MEVQWLKYSPADNMTALVTTAVPSYQRADVGRAIMRMDPSVEQVGFLVETKWPESSGRVEMVGSEFCCGAMLCAAAYTVVDRLEPGRSALFPLESSGVPDFITAMATARGDFTEVSLELPLPTRVDSAALTFGGKSYRLPLVKFPGMTYAILPADSMERSTAEDAVREWARIQDAEAMGLLFYDASAGYMEPLVYVPSANTLFWQRSAAGGAAAVGAFLSTMARADQTVSIRQPGGVQEVRCAFRTGRLSRVAVFGAVERLTENMLAF